jgi:hypothetical protein
MRKVTWAALAVIFALAPGVPRAAEPTPADDVAALRTYMDKNRAYSASARGAAEAEVQKLEARAASFSKPQMELAAARIAALADNGHSVLFPGFWTQHYPRIPWRLQMMSGRLYVVVAPDAPNLVGAEVVALDGVATAQVRTTYSRYQGGRDSFKDQFFPIFAETPALLRAAGFAGSEAGTVLTLRTRAGAEVRRELAAKPQPLEGDAVVFAPSAIQMAAADATAAGRPLPLYLRDPGKTFLLAPASEADALYIALRSNRDGEDETIANFLRRAEVEIERTKPTNLIVDLRFNIGGDLTTTRDFMSALPSRVPGRIFVITSGKTFSAGISSAGYLKQAGGERVTIVGEPAGDRLSFWAEGDMVELPWSGAHLLYATERHDYATGCPEADCHANIRKHPIRVKTLDPDIPAPLTIDAWLAGEDPAMTAILKVLGKPQAAAGA